MSTQEAEHLEGKDVAPTDARDEKLVRTFPVDISSGDGRTIEARIVPYNEAATVGDPPWAPKVIYRESFMPGAFAAQTKAADRVKVWLNFEHEQGLRGIVGHGIHLREQPDALYGTFRVHDNPDGDKALALVNEGLLDSLSLEFVPLRAVRREDGLVQRTKVHLDTVSLCRKGAYEQSRVLAVRSKPVELSEADLPRPLDPALALLLRSHGVAIPEGLSGEVLMRAFSEAAWDGSASRWPDAESYCASSLIDYNEGDGPKTKDKCHLPVKEPGSGDVNVNALRAALSRLGQGFPKETTQAVRDKARAQAERMLAEFNAKQGTSA